MYKKLVHVISSMNIELVFIQKKHNSMTFLPKTLPTRGISSPNKKATILKDVVPLMAINRRVFWKALQESETSILMHHQFGELGVL